MCVPKLRLKPSASADILLVDDDPDARSLVRDALTIEPGRWRVHEVGTGGEAVDFLRRRGRFAGAPRPAAVVLDVEMPGLSGLKLLEMIRSDPLLAEMPAIIVSSAVKGQEADLIARGADAVLAKPPAPEALCRALERAVVGSQSEPRRKGDDA